MRTLRVTLMCSVVLGFAAASAWAATVYKWVDEKGVTHYSDQPHPNASKVDVSTAQTYSAPPAPRTDTPAKATRADPGSSYASCELYRPENDEVFLNTDTVVAKLRIDPGLRGEDRTMVVLDGK